MCLAETRPVTNFWIVFTFLNQMLSYFSAVERGIFVEAVSKSGFAESETAEAVGQTSKSEDWIAVKKFYKIEEWAPPR
jgi:hypothetical protein